MTILYGLYNGINLDYGSALWQQLIQSLASSSRHTEVFYARFWTLVTKWAMDKLHVLIVADSPLSSISVFHTTKIIVTDPTKFSFIGSIPESMYAGVSKASIIMKTYKEFRPSGPREPTAEMVQSINDADKPPARGKKPDKGKLKKQAQGAKGPSPKKRKPSKTDQSPPPPPPPPKRKKTQPRRKLILASSSSDSEADKSDSEVSARGDTPPYSPSHEVPVSSKSISSPPTTIPNSIPPITTTISIPPITSSIPIPPPSIPIPPPIFTEATKTTISEVRTNVSDTGDQTSTPETTFTTEPSSTPEPTPTTEPPTSPLSPTPSAETETFLGGENMTFDSTYYNPYRIQSDDDDDAPVTRKHIKELHEKIDNLIASSSSSRSHVTEVAIQKMVDAFTNKHEASITSATVAIDASSKA
ncbi:flocculation protein FLO11-like [Lactuca sativa]|uniref:flocculation protein FLO11-like n=1 Tax=Lactuca sativa TaxID=4236 RepID=UPI0022AEDA34|nr:flocculation protein FLO11-like [Lactuca sativa]